MDKYICINISINHTNCCIIPTDKNNAIVIDPGDNAEKILEAAKKENLTIKAIIFTHGHFDHIGGGYNLVKKTGAKVYIHTFDAEMLSDTAKNLAFKNGFDYQAVKEDVRVNDCDIIELDNLKLEVIHTPGHSKGSIVIKCDGVLYCGDTLFKGGCGRINFYGGNENQMLHSLAKLANLDGDYIVVAGHGEQSTLAIERIENSYMRYACNEVNI